jgi:protein-arginine kinase activator protein McsA
MTSFKYKPCKIKFTNEINTLDTTHKSFLTKFKKNNNDLHLLKNKIDQLEQKLTNNNKNIDLETKSSIRKEIIMLQEQVKDIENNFSEINYYSIVGDFIIDYYEDAQPPKKKRKR